MSEGVTVTWLIGEKRLEPIIYTVTTDRIAGFAWRYWVESPFLRMGPFYRKAEANYMKAMVSSYG